MRPAVGRLGGAEVTILVASAVGTVGVMWFPGEVGTIAGSGTLIAYLLEGVVLALSMAATLAVVRRHPGRRTSALAAEVLGPVAAPLATLTVAAVDLALSAVVLSASAVTMTINFLPLTPLWAVELLLLAPAAYGATLGLEPLARALDLAAPITLAVLIATCLFALTQARFGPAVVPHPPAVGGWAAVLRGAYAGIWVAGGLTIIPNVCAQLAREQRPRLVARVVSGAAIAAVVAFGLLVLDLSVLGVVGLSWYAWPTVSMLRQTRTEAFLINRVSGLDEWVLVVMVWGFVGLHVWNAAVNVMDVLASRHAPVQRRGPRVPPPNRLLGGALAAATFSAARLFGTGGSRLDDFSAAYLDPAVLAVAVALPAVLWAVDRARGGAARRGRA